MLKNRQPILTILGGMGPMAGVELHKRIILNTPAKKDQDHLNILHISFPCVIDDRTRYVKSLMGINPGLQAGQVLKNTILSTNQNQGDKNKYVVGVPCNTFHSSIIFNKFKETIATTSTATSKTNIKVINMVESTVSYIQKKNYKKIGILCTEGTRDSGVYSEIIKERGMDIIMVPKTQQNEVNDIIYNKEYGIKSLSYATDDVINKSKIIVESLINKGADTIILGCTELPIAIREKYYNGVEMIDPVDILAKKMIESVEYIRSNI